MKIFHRARPCVSICLALLKGLLTYLTETQLLLSSHLLHPQMVLEVAKISVFCLFNKFVRICHVLSRTDRVRCNVPSNFSKSVCLKFLLCNILPGLICIWNNVYKIFAKTFLKGKFMSASSFLCLLSHVL